MKRLFGLLIVAGLLMPLVGCADHDHDDDDDGASLKVKVNDWRGAGRSTLRGE